MAKQTIRDLDVAGKRLLVRVDFNLPHDKATGAIADDRRIRAALPTLNYALEQGASLVLISHMGRPEKVGKTDVIRLGKVAARLQGLIGRPVHKVDGDAIAGPEAQAACAALEPGGIVLLENVRFDPREQKGYKNPETGKEEGDPAFAAELAKLGDAYVNDAFGTCHRNDASMKALPEQFPPDRRALGFLVEKELRILDELLGEPRRPMVAIMGGAKISDKIQVIDNLLKKVDRLLIGGAMTYTFRKAEGRAIGKSLLDEKGIDHAKAILTSASAKLTLPEDVLIVNTANPAETKVFDGRDIPDGWEGMDIGPKTTEKYRDAILNAATVVWNGPVGKFEDEPYSRGTKALAAAMAESKAVTVVGGGETAEAAEKYGVADEIDHVSTGGGAFLEALEGRVFGSLKAIPDR